MSWGQVPHDRALLARGPGCLALTLAYIGTIGDDWHCCDCSPRQLELPNVSSSWRRYLTDSGRVLVDTRINVLSRLYLLSNRKVASLPSYLPTPSQPSEPTAPPFPTPQPSGSLTPTTPRQLHTTAIQTSTQQHLWQSSRSLIHHPSQPLFPSKRQDSSVAGCISSSSCIPLMHTLTTRQPLL